MLPKRSTDQNDVEKNEAFVRFFGRHLVSLSGLYYRLGPNKERLGQIQSFSYSGFIFSIQGVWCLLTAGHIIKDLEQHLKDGDILVTKYRLLDYFGPDVISRDPIPFDYVNADKYYIDNEKAGLDYGLIFLGPYYQRLLQANGIVAVAEENWKNQHKVDFGYYMMIGLPQKFMKTDVKKNNGKSEVQVFMHPTAIFIDKLNAPPSNAIKTKYPRFIGKIPDECLLNIDGMSGGPILGFSKEADRYLIVAIQSRWLPKSKIIFGCLIPLLGGFVEKMVLDTAPDDIA